MLTFSFNDSINFVNQYKNLNMKRSFLTSVLIMFYCCVSAQIKTPKPSPAATLKQDVGLTEIAVNYSRPSKKNRKIFGNLVPFNELWRTGANTNTTVKFSTPITVGQAGLDAGTYALYSKPGVSSWEIIFYKKTDNWGLPEKWDASQVAASLKVAVENYPVTVESFTITIANLSNDSADLVILWENTKVNIPIKTPANKTILSNIDKTLNGSPSFEDYYTAAVYLSSTNQNISKAGEYMKKAMDLNKDPKYWQLRQQSLLLSKIGAIASAKLSLKKATKAGNKDYIKLNTDSIKEWSK